MFSDTNVLLSSDVFLSYALLLFLSMLGLRLLPFNFILSNLDKFSLHEISAFYHYEQLSLFELRQMQRSYARISRAHKRIGYELWYPTKLEQLADVTRNNAILTRAIARRASEAMDLDVDGLGSASSNELREVREALRHFVRDWSAEGKKERDEIMGPILKVLKEIDPQRRRDLKVLVPGSGLGRLAWEISRLGFTTYANELSSFMNICFRFLLSPEHTYTLCQHTLHPYAHWFSHQRNNLNLFRSIPFPDALPRLSDTFHHIPSDFMLLTPVAEQGDASGYDYIITQFFIDTSYNIISTLEQIHLLLKPGGTWINLGPLLWRSGAQTALELSLDEVLTLVDKVGFAVDEGTRKTVECEYTADEEAMMRWVYRAEFWVAVKR